MDPNPPPPRDILSNPPAFPAAPATTTLLTSPPTTPIHTIQTYETPDRVLTGLRVTWMNGDRARLGVCPADTTTTSTRDTATATATATTADADADADTDTVTKTFTFERQERIQIMYVYVGSTQVDGFWFVTNKQKSFFPGRSSERREMSELGSGVLVGMEGREKLDEEGRVEGILGLGVSFRR